MVCWFTLLEKSSFMVFITLFSCWVNLPSCMARRKAVGSGSHRHSSVFISSLSFSLESSVFSRPGVSTTMTLLPHTSPSLPSLVRVRDEGLVSDLNTSLPRIVFPAALFPTPLIPTNTSFSSGRAATERKTVYLCGQHTTASPALLVGITINTLECC